MPPTSMPANEPPDIPEDIGDAVLVSRVQHGDRAAFYRIVQQHTDALLRIAHGYLKSRSDAEDIVQELYFQIWRTRSHWEPRGTIGSYLALSVRRRALDVLKHRRIESTYVERIATEAAHDPDEWSTAPSEHTLSTRDEHTNAMSLVEQLNDRFRMVLLLRYAQQRSFAEIAEILEISIPAARQLAHRAVEQLRKLSRP